MPLRIEHLLRIPWFKSVSDVGEPSLSKLWVIAQQDRFESCLVDPIQALFGVGLFVVVVCIEAIRLQSARGIQNEDLEHRLSEPKTSWSVAFRKSPNEQVQFFDVLRFVAIDLFNFLDMFLIWRQLIKATDWIHP